MLTSTNNNQYIKPEYLVPIQGNSIELDAKKSPLALLAATCSQIGSDGSQKSPNGDASADTKPSIKERKSISPSHNNNNNKSPDNILSMHNSLSKLPSFRPYEKKELDESNVRNSPSSRKTPTSRSPTSAPISPGMNGRRTPQNGRSHSRNSDNGRPTSANRHNANEIPISSSSPTSRLSSSLSSSLSSLAGLSELCKNPLLDSYKLPPSLYPALGLGFDHIGAASLAALSAKVSTPTSSHSPATSSTTSSSSHSSSFTAALSSPYIGWSRVKTQGGTETVVPVCRDPYCAGCQVNAHAAQVVSGTCPPACNHCNQVANYTKSLTASLPSILHSLQPSLSSFYSPPSLLSSATQQQNVCSWISGDNYCGKRFNSSEELLQHLRSHTSSAATDSPTSALASLHHALHPSAATHPLLAGHLPRGYPTPSLSPLSAARYHPYITKPSLGPLPPAAHLPPASALSMASLGSLSALAPHPLSAYYNPYSIYARSLGATSGLLP